jgi:hypothetical protein
MGVLTSQEPVRHWSKLSPTVPKLEVSVCEFFRFTSAEAGIAQTFPKGIYLGNPAVIGALESILCFHFTEHP